MDYFAGLDISMDETHVCVLDREGAVVYECKSALAAVAIADELSKAPSCRRIVFETGRMAPILFHGLSQLGLPVVCVESRQAYQALNRHEGANTRCSGSNRPDQLSASCLFTRLSTTPSTSSPTLRVFPEADDAREVASPIVAERRTRALAPEHRYAYFNKMPQLGALIELLESDDDKEPQASRAIKE